MRRGGGWEHLSVEKSPGGDGLDSFEAEILGILEIEKGKRHGGWSGEHVGHGGLSPRRRPLFSRPFKPKGAREEQEKALETRRDDDKKSPRRSLDLGILDKFPGPRATTLK